VGTHMTCNKTHL